MNNMRIFSIGKIENNEKMVCINLDEKYAKGLRGLDGYSHVQVLWWADAVSYTHLDVYKRQPPGRGRRSPPAEGRSAPGRRTG